MTNKNTSNNSSKKINALFNESTIHGDILLSPYEEIQIPYDDLTIFEEFPSKTNNISNIKENEELNLQGQEENHNPTHDKKMDSYIEPTESIYQNESTNDNHDITSNDNINKNHTNFTHDDIIERAKYRYGRKGSMTPSTFKKFQPPFNSKIQTITPIPNPKPNKLDQIILSLLNEKTNLKLPSPPNPEPKEINPLPRDINTTETNDIDKINNSKDKGDTYLFPADKTMNSEKEHPNLRPIQPNNQSIDKRENQDASDNITTLLKEVNNHTNTSTATNDNTYTNIVSIPTSINSHLSRLHTTPININEKSHNGHILSNPNNKIGRVIAHDPHDDHFKLHNKNLDNSIHRDINTPIHHITPFLQTPSDSNKKPFNLPPELEPLKTVILSQHNALRQHIIELGKTSLHYSNTIKKKKDSSINLIVNEKIPRSLRIKCDLITSPNYEDNPNFIILKKELQDAVSQFMSTGLEIMKKWSIINVNLLIKDKCNNIMKTAIVILEGLYSYWEDIIGLAHWPDEIERYILLLLLKIYFETDYISDIEEIIAYFELPPNDILLLASGIITHCNDDIKNQSILTSIDQLYLNFSNSTNTQLSILKETLSAFDSILRATTIHLWEFNLLQLRELEASQKLKTKMETHHISSATAATAKSINKAIETIETTNATNQATHIRILNLEKQLKQQTQTNNEILNHLKKQKNSNGSHPRPVTSPTNPFFLRKRNIMDLTTASSHSLEQKQSQEYNFPQTKKPKGIKWNISQNKITEYNPITTPQQIFSHSPLLHPLKQPNPFQSTILQKRHLPYQTNNPFHSTTPQENLIIDHTDNPFSIKNAQIQNNQQRRDAKFREGRRGSFQRSRNN